jgi:serine/threonine-protein kinase
MPSSDPETSNDVSELEVRAQLDRILQSRPFRGSERLRRFLKFAVESALEGKADQLKESVLGREVYDRGAEYDPRTDSIVRVESQRLRRRLREYYEGEGLSDPLTIAFHAGSYVPAFTLVDREDPDELHRRSLWPDTGQPDPQTVAVLPFSNLSADPEQEYFCDGITDDVIYALSRIPGLTVIGHTSVFALKGGLQGAKEVGARLGAGTVVDGSVRRSGDRLKIFTEMIDAATGEVRWAESYDRTVEAIFSVETEIAQAVARVLQMTLAPPVSRRLIRGAPSMDAYLLYLEGRYALNRLSESGYRAAASIFVKAISSFPFYASPLAGLADANAHLALWGYARPREAFPKAQQAALQALKLDSLLPHAYSSLAAATAFCDWKWEEAAAFARKAIELEPSYAFGQQIYGLCLLARGEADEARECFERAVALDPLSVRAHRLLGWALYLQGRASSAEKWLQAALVLDREPLQTHYLLAHVYLSQHRLAAALEHARQCQTEPPDALGLGVLGACLARLNQREEALEILTRISRLEQEGYIDPHAAGQIHIGLGQTDMAIECIARSLEERAPFAVFLKLDPEFDPLRRDIRFEKLVSRLGM